MPNKHSKLLHKVEVVADEPVPTVVPAVEPPAPTITRVESYQEPEIEMGGGEMLGMNIEGSQESGGKMVWVVVAILVAVAVVVIGVVIVYFSRQRVTVPVDPTLAEPTVTSAPSISIVPTVLPTPIAGKVDLSKLKVQVLNGSGKKGEANVVANLLAKAGFKNIDTGNAKKFDYTVTLIESKTGGVVPEELIEALKDYKTGVDDGGGKLSADSKYDIIITVGSKKL